MDAVAWCQDEMGWFEAGLDPPEEVSDRTTEECPPAIEYDPEEGYVEGGNDTAPRPITPED